MLTVGEKCVKEWKTVQPTAVFLVQHRLKFHHQLICKSVLLTFNSFSWSGASIKSLGNSITSTLVDNQRDIVIFQLFK